MTHFPPQWRVQPHDNYMPEGYDVPVEIIAADGQTVACNTAFYPTEITAGNAALIVAAVNATAPTVAAQQCGRPEGLDATDMDMIRRGDMLGPALGARVASLIQSQAARIAELEALVGAFVRANDEGPGLIDCIDNHGERYTSAGLDSAIRAARSLLNGERKG